MWNLVQQPQRNAFQHILRVSPSHLYLDASRRLTEQDTQ